MKVIIKDGIKTVLLVFVVLLGIFLYAQSTTKPVLAWTGPYVNCYYTNVVENPTIYNGQMNVSLSPVGHGNSYNVYVSGSGPYHKDYYTDYECNYTYQATCIQYSTTYPYGCVQYDTPPANYTTNTSVYVFDTNVYDVSGSATISETSNNSTYLNNLISTTESCSGSSFNTFVNTVSVNNTKVFNYNNVSPDPGRQLSPVTLTATLSGGQYCNTGGPATATMNLREGPFILSLAPDSSLPFNTEQYGGNPDGTIIYTLSTSCTNGNLQCSNSSRYVSWSIQTNQPWLYLWDGKVSSEQRSITVYCINPTNKTSTNPNLYLYCDNNNTDTAINSHLWARASNTQNMASGSGSSAYQAQVIVSPSSFAQASNPVPVTLNIYASWISTSSGGNAYSRGGFNITTPPSPATPTDKIFTNALLETLGGGLNFENGTPVSYASLEYANQKLGLTQNGIPIYDFNFYTTLYCEITGKCQGAFTNGIIQVNRIPSNQANLGSLQSMTQSNPNWYFYQGNLTISQNTVYTGSAVLIVNGNVTITPSLYPQTSTCTIAGSSPLTNVQACPGLVIIAKDYIEITSNTPSQAFSYDRDLDANTNSDVTSTGPSNVQEPSGGLSMTSPYDVVDALLISMGKIVIDN
ncbi:MAG: hypothetical protein ACYDAS_02155 [Patescibacteria group bacterium]